MAATAVFSCPSCAASLDVEGNESSLECPFCGSTVVIPEALRRYPEPVVQAAAPPQIIIATTSFNPYASARPVVIRRQQSSGCAQAFTVLITLVIVSVVSVAGFLLKTNPGLLSGLSKSIGQAIPAYADITLNFGGAGTGSGLFQDARHIGVDGKGNVYVSEQKSRRIQKFDSTGNFVKSWLVEGKGQISPGSMAVDRAGNVYVAMYSNVLQYDGESGTLIKKFGASVPGDLLFEVKTLPDGNIIAATMDGTLVWFDSNGNVTRRVEKAIENITEVRSSMPRIAVDSMGNVYMLGTFDNRGVYRFSAQGKYVNRFGSEGKGRDQFDFPQAIALDNQGRVYVSDRGVIKVFTNDGRYLDTIKMPGYGVPFGLAIDLKNNIYATFEDHVYQLVVRPAANAK